jgi:amino acid adenylation domain-containing protein
MQELVMAMHLGVEWLGYVELCSDFKARWLTGILGKKGNIQLQATMSDGSLWLRPCWREPLGAEYIATHFAHALVEILNKTFANLSAPLSTILQLSEVDRSEIWRWNRDLPPAVDTCIQELISEQVRRQPTAQAICSWDGDLSYEEVGRYSTLLAHHLLGCGVQVGQIVPLCFEKSRWTVVGVLGILKAGGAIVLMDPSQPLERRQTIAEQVDAKLIVTSKTHEPFGPKIAPAAHTVVVAQAEMDALSQPPAIKTQTTLPTVPTDSILYLIFTSGSTGKPKGVIINHVTYTTSAIARSAAVGYTDKTRVLDFASYAFDVSVDSMLCTMLRGGCLCIPSDEDRLNDLSGVIRRMGVTMSNMTPSVARILDPDIIPSLHSLGLGGESCSVGDVSEWGKLTRIVVGYGPSECTVGCTINSSAAGKPYVSIGPGNGGVIWLVDPDDHNKLVPIGAVGELLVEGHIVGQGYLGDPQKTAESFIEDPQWLLEGSADIPGRKGRLYKTGDLVRYDPDGERGFVFVGRKDTQVKLRGQRVELGEIEYHVRRLLPPGTDVAVEVVAPQGRSKESMLLAFVADQNAEKPAGGANDGLQQVQFSAGIQEKMNDLDEEISKVLPVYMVPSLYIGINHMPLLVSGKTDRKLLRAFGSQMSLQSSPNASPGDLRKPNSSAEICLHEIWCHLLGLTADQVSTAHNFFILGGDSVLAMKLVPAVREQGFVLTVADIFNFPVLSDMASSMQTEEADSQVEVLKFSLIDSSWNLESACTEASEKCNVEKTCIEDIYPCTPLQEILMAFSARSAESYVAQRIAEVPSMKIAERLKNAWTAVAEQSPILRTRVVEFKDQGFMQVVTNKPPEWQHSEASLDAFLKEDQQVPMSVNMPLSRYTIVRDESLDKIYFVWTVHHAIYDGWSTDLIIEHAKNAYNGGAAPRPAEFRHFIRYLTDPARESSKDYWRVQLQGATGPQFPSLPSRMYIPEPNALAERFVSVQPLTRTSITTATLIRAAWALVAAQYTMSDDVVFGETFAGRTLPIPGVEQIEGPMIATVPVRIRIDRSAPIQEYLRAIQEHGLVRSAHEHLGMQNIRRVSADAQLACEVKMGLVIQPRQSDIQKNSDDELPSFRIEDAAHEALRFNSYPLMLACSLHSEGFHVTASFDSNLVSEPQMNRVLAQLEYTVSYLCKQDSLQLCEMSSISDQEMAEIWQLNKDAPTSSPQTGDLMLEEGKGLTTGDKYTTNFVPWIVHPSDHNKLVPIGTIGELLLEGAGAAANIEAPQWLAQGAGNIPGRQERLLYQTGDLVKYADDKSLIFMGRKESLRKVDGHVMDLAAIDLQLRQALPAGTDSVTQLIVPKGSAGQSPALVAFVSETLPTDGRVVDLGVDSKASTLPMSTVVSTQLVESVVGLNKVLSDVLPPYMIPSVYIPIEKLPYAGEQIEVKVVKAMTEHVTQDLLLQLRTAFVNIHPGKSEAVHMTMKERTLRSLWAKSLGMEEDKLALDDNFFRLGGDSIMAMKLVSALRLSGYHLSVTDIFRNMQLRSMASALEEVSTEEKRPAKVYAPFSLLKTADLQAFLSKNIQPMLAGSAWQIQDVLPATDTQERDVEATVSAPRSAIQYNMLYLKKDVDVERLVTCFNSLVAAHPILRTVFVQESDRVLQVVLQDLVLPVSEHNTDDPIDVYCKDLAKDDIKIDSSFKLGKTSLGLFVVRGADENGLMIRISHAQYDGISFPELLRQLEMQYEDKAIPSSPPFSTFVQYQADSRLGNIAYWCDMLQGSRLTSLPPSQPAAPTAFIKKAVDVSARSPNTTMATLLTASWARVLAQHLNTEDITLGGVVSGRTVDVPDVDRIVGPTYQYMPLRIKFEPGLTGKGLMDSVRDQYLESSRHATLGFQEISDNCTSWSPNATFYPSIVHHHDIEYFDSIPFAGSEARVDYTNPHPEPASPTRVVSYTEAGETFVGIVADEENLVFWEERLEELAVAMESFVTELAAL